MKIVLTNDDGIHSPGILLLADGLRGAGHRVFTLAPAANRSGVSHAISFLHGPCKITEKGKDTWSCEGTPADCVVLALQGGLPELNIQNEPVNLIISGINRGANLGTDIVYSGTAAAARQGALHHIPSLALSLHEGDPWHWEMAADFAVERLDEMMAYWKPDSFVNVNIPNRQEKPLKIARAFPSFRYYNDSIDLYHAGGGRRYCFAKGGEVSAKPERGSDCEAVAENNASLSEIYIHPLLLESVKGRES